MNKLNNTLLFILLLLPFCSIAQRDKNPCDLYENYTPSIPEHTPIKNVCIAIHVFQKDDGTANFQQKPNHIKWIKKIVASVNATMGSLPPMRLESKSAHIVDSRIRYKLDTIFFHRDDSAWNMKCKQHYTKECRMSKAFGDGLYKKYIIENPVVVNKYNCVHIFMGENQKLKGRASGIGDKRWTIVSDSYNLYKEGNFWLPAGLIRHELGHNIGLLHTWNQNDGCDDTPRNLGKWNCDTCSNNMMDYNASMAALTECQLGRAHYYLSGKRGNIADAIIKDYCTYDSLYIDIRPGENVVWKSEKHLKGDIIIRRNATLTIMCLVSLPENAEIIIKKKGKLIIDGGIITNICGNKWKGISAKAKNKDSYIEIKNNGRIENNRL